MAIHHKFLNHTWENGFQTHNSILDTVPYDPEVIFIGTFNPDWEGNPADFFYGRGMYMWTIMANLLQHNHNHLTQRRNLVNNIPTLDDIFTICEIGKIVFADIVKGTNPDIPTAQVDNSILVNNEYDWCDYKDKHLNYMGAAGWLDDNVDDIVAYINATPSIKHIYFTFKSGGWLVQKLNSIIALTNTLSAGSVFSPTGNGFGENLQLYPTRAWSLAHCWVWNGLPHPNPLDRLGYSHLDHSWLISKGVNPANF